MNNIDPAGMKRGMFQDSDSEDSFDDEMNAETEALIRQSREIQQVLHNRNQQVQEMNQSTMEALGSMDFLKGVQSRVRILSTGAHEIGEFQRDISTTLHYGEEALKSRKNELLDLQAQVQILRQQINKAPSSPNLGFVTELGKRVGEYLQSREW
jgi:hypothetical protein